MIEFFMGGLAASLAGLITNPLEVVKTRVQLQGELMKRGNYTIHYRNVFHALVTITKKEGLHSVQKGLVPALYYQFWMNGTRLGFFQSLDNLGVTRNTNGQLVPYKVAICASAAGAIGSFISSPFFMIKTQLQTMSNATIAVGHQHHHSSFHSALYKIFHSQGIRGLWRGAPAAILRTSVTSSIQLSTFSLFGSHLTKYQFIESHPFIGTVVSSMFSGLNVSTAVAPFDVISNRLYNQPLDPITKKGLIYNGIFDCALKIFRSEGLLGFYKGWTALVLRSGPHSILSLCFWKQIRDYHSDFQAAQLQSS